MASLFIKRRYTRVQSEKNRPIRVDFNGENFLDILSADNISEGGLSLVVHHEFKGCKIDEPVSLIVTLPYPIEQSISVSGIIRYISVSHRVFGVAFQGLTDRDRRKIHQYISYRIKDRPWFTRFGFKVKTAMTFKSSISASRKTA